MSKIEQEKPEQIIKNKKTLRDIASRRCLTKLTKQ